MAGILLGTGLTGVFVDLWLLRMGLERVWLRYPIAVLGSYFSFLFLMRLWLSYISKVYAVFDAAKNFEDGAEELDDNSRTGSWDGSGLDALGVPPDADPCGCLFTLIGLMCVLFISASLSLIYEAPIILTEAAFQFLVAAGLVRTGRKIDRPDWVGSTIARTWKPFAAILAATVMFSSCAGVLCDNPTDIRHMISSCGKGNK